MPLSFSGLQTTYDMWRLGHVKMQTASGMSGNAAKTLLWCLQGVLTPAQHGTAFVCLYHCVQATTSWTFQAWLVNKL